MSRNLKPIGGASDGRGGGRKPTREASNSRNNLVAQAYKNNIITKNEDGEYAPIGENSFSSINLSI